MSKTDLTDAGPRLRAMNDALTGFDQMRAEIERLHALVESLRREVREQRLEIAGLREERRAVLEADRPQPDRPEAIPTDNPPEAVESIGDSLSDAGKSVETDSSQSVEK